eukprot:13790502-Alexandrium_andersonii.AAC.1
MKDRWGGSEDDAADPLLQEQSHWGPRQADMKRCKTQGTPGKQGNNPNGKCEQTGGEGADRLPAAQPRREN